MDIIGHLTKLQANVFVNRNDDDLADRLNYRYTVAILVSFAVIVTHRQFSESVIRCWVPAWFTTNYEQYANQVCWVSNLYWVNQNQVIPKLDETKKSNEIKYYQWIPALFLYIPRILWRLLTARAGIDMRDLIEAAHSYKSVDKFENKKKIMEYIVHNIDQYASNPRRSKYTSTFADKAKFFGESLVCGSGIYLGNYLVTTYFFIKLVYIFNSIAQFYLMNEFLGKQFHQLGIDVLRYLTNSYTIETAGDSVYFPKVVMCDFLIREFGHPNFSHKYSIQCVLPINLYNQQIFTFLWFWFLILFVMNTWALVNWFARMMPSSRRQYIKKRLNLLKYFKELNEKDTKMLKKKSFLHKKSKLVSVEARLQRTRFINQYLQFDGVFILRMIAMLTSELVATELLYELWDKKGGFRDANNPQNISTPHEMEPEYDLNKMNPFKRDLTKVPALLNDKDSGGKPGYFQSLSAPAGSVDCQRFSLKNIIKEKLQPKRPNARHGQLTTQIIKSTSTGALPRGRIERARLERTYSLQRPSLEQLRASDETLMILKSGSLSLTDSPSLKTKTKRVVWASSTKKTIEEDDGDSNIEA